MKRIIGIIATLFIGLMTVHAMSYEEACERARFLTDKMAYELNLNDAQYNDAYEINLDYLMNIRTADDVTGIYWSHRNADLRYILYDWQYDLFCAASYFFRPVVWRVNVWHFPVCDFYRPGHFFYNPPRVYTVYRGGHYGHRNIHHVSFYADRRPGWHGGFRGKTHAPIVHHPAAPRENGFRGRNINRPSISQREPRNGMRSPNGYRIGNVNDNGNRPAPDANRTSGRTDMQQNTGSLRNSQMAQRPTRTQSTSRGATQSSVQGRSGQAARSTNGRSTYGRSNSTTSSYNRPSSTRTTVNRTSTGGNSTTRTQSAPRTPSRSSSVSRSSSPERSRSSASSASRSGRSSRR